MIAAGMLGDIAVLVEFAVVALVVVGFVHLIGGIAVLVEIAVVVMVVVGFVHRRLVRKSV